jgi:hypothetical protein
MMPHMNENRTPVVKGEGVDHIAPVVSLRPLALVAVEPASSLRPCGPTVLEVLLSNRRFKIDLTDVRKGGKPGEHIGEFFPKIRLISVSPLAAAEGFGQLSDLFTEPKERSGDTSGGIRLVVSLTNELLKLGKLHENLQGGVRFRVGLRMWSGVWWPMPVPSSS